MKPRNYLMGIPLLAAFLFGVNYFSLSQRAQSGERASEEKVSLIPAFESAQISPRKKSRVASLLKAQETNASDSQQELDSFLANCSQEELNLLGQLVLQDGGLPSVRRMSLYILSLALPRSLPQLTEIAARPVMVSGDSGQPHSQAAMERKQELALRIGAVVSLDSVDSGSDARAALLSVVHGEADPSIKSLAAIALSGWADNRPHRLQRFVDQMDKNKFRGKL